MECDTLLVCIGRKPYTEGLGLEVCCVQFSSLFHCNAMFSNWGFPLMNEAVFQLIHVSRPLRTSKHDFSYWHAGKFTYGNFVPLSS